MFDSPGSPGLDHFEKNAEHSSLLNVATEGSYALESRFFLQDAFLYKYPMKYYLLGDHGELVVWNGATRELGIYAIMDDGTVKTVSYYVKTNLTGSAWRDWWGTQGVDVWK